MITWIEDNWYRVLAAAYIAIPIVALAYVGLR